MNDDDRNVQLNSQVKTQEKPITDEPRPTTPDNEWIEEANAVISDIQSCVSQAVISHILTSHHGDDSATCVYLNILTLESIPLCIRLSAAGFAIVGHKFDDNSSEHEALEANVFETPYALLQSVSPAYSSQFATQLFNKLEALNKSEV